MRTVTHRRIAMAIRIASKVGVLFHCCFICCCPGGHWGNTEQVVARWRRPEASGIAQDMLHWVMHFLLHRHTAMAIEMAGRQGALFPTIDLCLNINVAKELCNGSLKLKTSYTNVHYYVYCYFVPYWPPPSDGDGCRFGHRCCRRTSPIREHTELNRNQLISTLI
jgi:hypothetical protein